ncbi:cytochrome c family protein [Rubellimicrobium sp. CFH 75288]|uniref:c-type cytochrome n=1 Tax=Rubellimicrobium sp. CFH 75288 TaxID=2697034 RepID=UPI0014128278|nr:c-type cytochrome [Rubellimicrobium sp. CFH 75288]
MRIAAIAVTLLAPAALCAQDAGGDAAAGETLFARQCVSCHIIADESGEVLAGRASRTGPNLYQVVGRVPGSREDFNYSRALEAYGALGVVWEQENLVSYLLDPNAHLREALGDAGARSQMAYRVRNEEQAVDIVAYLESFGRADAEDGAEDGAEDAPAE